MSKDMLYRKNDSWDAVIIKVPNKEGSSLKKDIVNAIADQLESEETPLSENKVIDIIEHSLVNNMDNSKHLNLYVMYAIVDKRA